MSRHLYSRDQSFLYAHPSPPPVNQKRCWVTEVTGAVVQSCIYNPDNHITDDDVEDDDVD